MKVGISPLGLSTAPTNKLAPEGQIFHCKYISCVSECCSALKAALMAVEGQTHLAGRFERRNGHFAAAGGGETLRRRADGLSDGDGPRRGHRCILGQNPSCGKGQEHLTSVSQ